MSSRIDTFKSRANSTHIQNKLKCTHSCPSFIIRGLYYSPRSTSLAVLRAVRTYCCRNISSPICQWDMSRVVATVGSKQIWVAPSVKLGLWRVSLYHPDSLPWFFSSRHEVSLKISLEIRSWYWSGRSSFSCTSPMAAWFVQFLQIKQLPSSL